MSDSADIFHHDVVNRVASIAKEMGLPVSRLFGPRAAAPGEILTVPDHKSDIDESVLAMKSNTGHVWESIKIDDASCVVCTRCGRLQDSQLIEHGNYLPCRGFIG